MIVIFLNKRFSSTDKKQLHPRYSNEKSFSSNWNSNLWPCTQRFLTRNLTKLIPHRHSPGRKKGNWTNKINMLSRCSQQTGKPTRARKHVDFLFRSVPFFAVWVLATRKRKTILIHTLIDSYASVVECW